MTSALAAIVIISIAGLLLTWWSRLPPRPDLAAETASEPGETSRLDQLLSPLESEHVFQSGYRLVADGQEAFMLRARSAQAAQRSLDVQTYIWRDDLTGLSLARELLQAADRGVKVRLLVDDFDARAHHRGYSLLAAHENISVRLFNPFTSRAGYISKILEGLHNIARLNHRMHNKSWIADNRLALVGGRNLGDEYFGASEGINFIDLDLALAGPVVRDISEAFDRYWNAAASYPVRLLNDEDARVSDLQAIRATLVQQIDGLGESRYEAALSDNPSIKALLAGDWDMLWTEEGCFVADDPRKALKGSEVSQSSVLVAIVDAIQSASEEVTIISPYFVPGEAGTEWLIGLVSAGLRTRVLTNSLAANDVAAVHGGYARHRKALLKGGVELWELKPTAGQRGHGSLFGSKKASLHTKALTIDGQTLFVGSYNLDPRSTALNTEQGVLVTAPALAEELDSEFNEAIRHAWQVRLDENDDLIWQDGTTVFDSEPEATAWRRLQAAISRLLHLDAQL